MLTQDDLERERYESRRKAQLDHNQFMLEAREDGLEEGRALGLELGRAEGRAEARETALIEAAIKMIHLFERLLNRPETPAEQLSNMSLDTLDQMVEGMQRQLSSRQ